MDAPLVAALVWTASQTQDLAVGIVAISSAIVGGYVVSCLVPQAHYPRTFGVMTANAILAGLALLGVQAVEYRIECAIVPLCLNCDPY